MKKKPRIGILFGGRSGEHEAEHTQTLSRELDLVFPVLHGTFGEDGACAILTR